MSLKKMFQSDNVFNHVMTKIFDLMLLSVLWLIGCVPVFTIGASTIALYYVAMKMVRDEEEGIVRSFFRAFRENFRQSIPVTLILFLFIGVLAADFHILGRSEQKIHSLMYSGCITVFLIGTAVFGYVFPLLAKFENTVRNTIANAVKIVVARLWQTAVILILNCLPFAWFLISTETFSLVFWIWVFTGTGTVAFINSRFLVQIFDEFIPEKKAEKEIL